MEVRWFAAVAVKLSPAVCYWDSQKIVDVVARIDESWDHRMGPRNHFQHLVGSLEAVFVVSPPPADGPVAFVPFGHAAYEASFGGCGNLHRTCRLLRLLTKYIARSSS